MADAEGALEQALRPIARIASISTVSRGQPATLNGSGSQAARNRTVASYAWTVVSGTGTIANPSQANASVIVPDTGALTVSLTVTDDLGRTDSVNAEVVAGPVAGGGGGGGLVDPLSLLAIPAMALWRRRRYR
jgi:serine protease